VQVGQLQAELRTTKQAGTAANSKLNDAQREARALSSSASAAEEEARKLRTQVQNLDKRRQRDTKGLKELEARLAEVEGEVGEKNVQLDVAAKRLAKVRVPGFCRGFQPIGRNWLLPGWSEVVPAVP
jgi:predicted  nucleic acid-binding Zn-ribbon protein